MNKFIRKDSKFIVYKITHIDSGKSYIGITMVFQRRMRTHFNAYNYENSYLHRSIRKYGKEKFIHEIIHYCNCWKDLCQKEIEYIKIFNTKKPNGYNLTEGGEGKSGLKHSEETRKKISESNKGKIVSEETRRKIGAISANRSLKTCKKLSDAAKIFTVGQILEIRQRLSIGICHRIIAEKFSAHRTTISAIKRGEVYSDV